MNLQQQTTDTAAGRPAMELEADPKPGTVPPRVVTGLRIACEKANDHAEAFSEAVKAQAEKYNIAPGALRRYIKSLTKDRLADLRAETADVQHLIDG
jgi:hypothetical protein